jgi:hypothetical protein
MELDSSLSSAELIVDAVLTETEYEVVLAVKNHIPDIVKLNSIDLLMAVGNINSPLLDIPLKSSLAMKSGVGSARFTRNSTATYIDRYGVLQTAAIDIPRFEKEGYLNEGYGTNLLTYSNQFNTAGGWVVTSTAVATKERIGPDGIVDSAWYLKKTDFNASYMYKGAISLSSGTTYTFSFHSKKEDDGGDETYCYFPGNFFTSGVSRYVKYNFITKALTDVNNNLQDKRVVELADGWVRISMTFLVDLGATGPGSIIGSDVDIFGAQLEAFPFATSYIPTVASAATRIPDILNVDSAGNTPNVEANGAVSVLFDIDMFGGIDDIYQWVWGLVVPPQDFIALAISTSLQPISLAVSPTDECIVYMSSTIVPRNRHRIAQVISNAGHYTYQNGVQVGFTADTDSSITAACNSATTIRIGSASDDADPSLAFYGHISNFRVFEGALTSSEIYLA